MMMNQEQALNVVLTAVQIAQSKGAFTLQEAAVIAQAVNIFKPAEEPKQEEPTESPANVSPTKKVKKVK